MSVAVDDHNDTSVNIEEDEVWGAVYLIFMFLHHWEREYGWTNFLLKGVFYSDLMHVDG